MRNAETWCRGDCEWLGRIDGTGRGRAVKPRPGRLEGNIRQLDWVSILFIDGTIRTSDREVLAAAFEREVGVQRALGRNPVFAGGKIPIMQTALRFTCSAGANPLGFISCKGRTFCLLGTPIFDLFSAFRLNDERPLIAALGIGWAEV
jgi:hypothetical protein